MPRAIGGFNPAVTFGQAYKSTMGVLQAPEERGWELEKRGYERTGLQVEEAVSKEKMRLLEQDKKERETMVPVMNFAPQINQTPTLKNAWVNALKQAGHKYEEGEGGVAMVSTSGVNFIKKQMQTNLDFVETTLKAGKQDAQTQYNSIASEVSKAEEGGKPAKPELIQKMKAVANQIATITNSENFLKQQKGKDLAKRIKEQYGDQYQSFPESLRLAIDKLEETGDTDLYGKVVEAMAKQEFKTEEWKPITKEEAMELKRAGRELGWKPKTREEAVEFEREKGRIKVSTKEVNFKDAMLQKMWGGMTEPQRLRALGALPTDKELTDKDIVSAYTSIYTDDATRASLKPLYDTIMKKAGQKRIEAPKGETGVKSYIDKALRGK